MTIRLTEGAALKESGSKYRIRLLSEGVGTSGTYPADVLERDGAAAFPAGTQIFLDHLTENDEWQRAGNHSIKDLVGVTLTEATYVADEKALYAEARFYGAHKDFIAEAKDDIGLSVEARGVLADGIVESLVYSPLNAIAVVPRAGRDGKITELLESYRESGKIERVTETATNDSRGNDPERTKMDEKDIQRIVEALTPLFTSLTEALKPAEKPAEKTEGPDMATVAEAVVEAGLPKSFRAKVFESVAKGADAQSAIDEAKALVESVKAELNLTEKVEDENPGTLKESAQASGSALTVGAWS